MGSGLGVGVERRPGPTSETTEIRPAATAKRPRASDTVTETRARTISATVLRTPFLSRVRPVVTSVLPSFSSRLLRSCLREWTVRSSTLGVCVCDFCTGTTTTCLGGAPRVDRGPARQVRTDRHVAWSCRRVGCPVSVGGVEVPTRATVGVQTPSSLTDPVSLRESSRRGLSEDGGRM